jgi:2-(3-amino-3-carboxypropyl)histidine synthase
MQYDFELEKAIAAIKENNAKLVCLQLPDGLKQQANDIQQTIETQTDAKVLIWLGSCYGACDWPLGIDKLGIDLLIAWGHSVWKHDSFEGISVEE